MSQQLSGMFGMWGRDRNQTDARLYRPKMAGPALASTDLSVQPAGDTVATIVLAAPGAGRRNVISGVAWSYTAAPANGNLRIHDGAGHTFLSVDIIAGGPGFIPFDPGLGAGSNRQIILTLAAGGGVILGKLNVLGAWTEEV